VDAKRNQREEEGERERNEIKRMKRKLSGSKGQVILSIVFRSKYGNVLPPHRLHTIFNGKLK